MSLSPFFYLINDLHEESLPKEDGFFAGALKLAYFAMGNTHPNPSVGAVIVKDGHMVSQGFTNPVFGFHAEKQAIEQARADLQGAHLYVTLEPCCHFGRTPPCTDAIIAAGISRVIYGVKDPNPLVAGGGIKKLKEHGIETKHIKNPELIKRARAQIEPFKKWLRKQLPYITVKIASSSDKKISAVGKRVKITSEPADLMVHHLRRAHDGIMIGAGTARIDNPRLTARLDKDHHNSQPTRIILGSRQSLDEKLLVFNDEAKTILMTHKQIPESNPHVMNITVQDDAAGLDLVDVFRKLAALGYTSILVEPGAKLLQSLQALDLVDEVWWLSSPTEIGDDSLDVAEALSVIEKNLAHEHTQLLGVDELKIFKRNEEV